MRTKLLNVDTDKTYALIFEAGDEVISSLQEFARLHSLSASRFTAIGAFSHATLGYFDWQRRDYDRIEVTEQMEVLALVGDVALDRSDPKVHAHVVLGDRHGKAYGGHLLEAHVRPTLEVVLVESPGYLKRVYDPRVGLALIDADA